VKYNIPSFIATFGLLHLFIVLCTHTQFKYYFRSENLKSRRN